MSLIENMELDTSKFSNQFDKNSWPNLKELIGLRFKEKPETNGVRFLLVKIFVLHQYFHWKNL